MGALSVTGVYTIVGTFSNLILQTKEIIYNRCPSLGSNLLTLKSITCSKSAKKTAIMIQLSKANGFSNDKYDNILLRYLIP